MDFGRDQSQEEGKEDQGEVKELAPQLCQGLLVPPQKEGQEDKETFFDYESSSIAKKVSLSSLAFLLALGSLEIHQAIPKLSSYPYLEAWDQKMAQNSQKYLQIAFSWPSPLTPPLALPGCPWSGQGPGGPGEAKIA